MSEEIREAFERARANVERMQRGRLDPNAVTRAHTDEVDGIVVGAFERALQATGSATDGIALVALGGYGRRELAPCSDLDLLLLHRGWPAGDVASLNREFIYPLWDSRRELGDRVREPRDVVGSFDRTDEVCSVIDARLLAGDRGLFGDLVTSVSRRLERGRASFLARLRESISERHHRYGHAGQLLEPNIRDAAGGLRDIQTLGWAAYLLPGGEGVSGLVSAGFLSALDAELVGKARDFMTALRIELHLLTGRHQDQIHLAEQDAIAPRLGYESESGRPAANRLMQELYGHARQTDAVVQAFWGRIRYERRRRLFSRGSPRLVSRRAPSSESIGDGCVLQDGRVQVVAVTHPSDDAAGWLRAFARSVRVGAPIGRTSLNRLQVEVGQADAVKWSAQARDLFIDLLASGKKGVTALEQMDLTGLLVALLPEWGPIQAYPQRDLYHRYTVDRHLFACIAELGDSRDLEDADIREAWAKVGAPDALLLGAFLHDIGKGRGGDHSEIGAEISRDIAARMGLSPETTDEVWFLVYHHLLLPETGIRRDLNDPATIRDVAGKVGEESRLAMLYLLSRADALATGPEAWSSFRSSLVRELYGRTRSALDPRAFEDRASAETSSARRQLEQLRSPLGPNEVRVSVTPSADADELVVLAADRPGLFSTVAGVLALRGIDVHDAEIYTTDDGIAVEVFRVIGAHGPIPEDRWDRVQDDIVRALDGDFDVDAALGAKAAQARRRRPHSAKSGGVDVVVDNAASRTHTVVEVHTIDRLGLLRTITRALAESGCDLYLAKVSTYGTQVVDVFYVTDLDGSKVADPGRVEGLKESVRRAVVTYQME